MGRLGSSWLRPGSIPRVGAVSGACFPKILRSIGIAPGIRGFRRGKRRWKGRVSSCWLSRGWLGSCPGGLWPCSFPALFGFGDRSSGVTEFFKLSLSPLREFQLLFLQVAIRLPNHLLVVLEFWGEAEVSERSVICSRTSFSSRWRWSITVR